MNGIKAVYKKGLHVTLCHNCQDMILICKQVNIDHIMCLKTLNPIHDGEKMSLLFMEIRTQCNLIHHHVPIVYQDKNRTMMTHW